MICIVFSVVVTLFSPAVISSTYIDNWKIQLYDPLTMKLPAQFKRGADMEKIVKNPFGATA